MADLKLIERAKTQGDSLAIRHGERCLTYSELLLGSERMGAALLGGASDLNEKRVAMLCPNGLEFAISQWAVWRAGGICVPLSSSATELELEYAIADSQSEFVIASRRHCDRVATVCRKLGVPVVVFEEASAAPSRPLPIVSPQRRAMILYTSGTTNKPKGVVTTHANIEAQISSLVEAWEWQAADRIPLFLPLHHIHGIINVLSCALWSGAQVEAFDSFDMATILSRIAKQSYTLFMAVPTIYVKLIQTLEEADAGERQTWIDGFASMRLMVSGSAALPASVHQRWTELSGQKLLERYGMTEIGMAISNPLRGERRAGFVGTPLPRVEIRLESESGETILGENESGEIQVRGPTVFREYWNRPEATLESFDDGWFRTGDVAVRENGYYRIMGRMSVDIIKSGGYKLSALEIEETLLQHPSVLQCAVVGVPDAVWGEAVAAAIVARDRESIDLESLRTWCRERLSPYKLPKLLRVVPDLPRNAMGKVMKPAIKTLFNEDSAQKSQGSGTSEFGIGQV